MSVKRPSLIRLLCTQARIFGILFLISFLLTLLWLFIPVIVEPSQRLTLKHEGNDAARNSRLQRTAKLQSILDCHDRQLTTELVQRGDYWILKNIIRGQRSLAMGCAESITFTTIADYSYMRHLEILVPRWMGPISIALFAPGRDFNVTMSAIQYARHCLSISQLIRDYVSFHVYFPSDNMPSVQVPLTEQEALEWPHDCTAMFAPYEFVKRSKMFRHAAHIDYPINVGRNVARKAVNTHFILATDIELYPSARFIDQFLQMIANNEGLLHKGGGGGPRVFALPAFDLDHNAILPDNKDELMTMYSIEMALPIHARNCTYCRLIPNQNKWLRANNNSEKLEVLSVVKRYTNFPFWEPFYVSDNTEPEYDERFLWNFHSDKRMHNYVMCLLDYEYHILHPAFLTHSPLPRKYHRKEIITDFVEELVVDILPEYDALYGTNENCTV